jgi:hypothetical protein
LILAAGGDILGSHSRQKTVPVFVGLANEM